MEDNTELARIKNDSSEILQSISTNNNQNEESTEISDKKRLVEIYLVISGLLVSCNQITSALTSVSSNNSINQNNFVITVIPRLNIVFGFLILSILLYYVLLTQKSVPLSSSVIIAVSLFFGFIIATFLDIQSAFISDEIPNIIYFIISWVLISLMSIVALTTRKKIIDVSTKINELIPKITLNEIAKTLFLMLIITFLFLARATA